MKEDTYSYKGWLVSDKFIKRVSAITGYVAMGLLFLSIIVGFVDGLLM